jgi:hypothetical protein
MKSVSRIVSIECFRPSVASLFDFDSDLSFLVNIVSETIDLLLQQPLCLGTLSLFYVKVMKRFRVLFMIDMEVSI